MNDLHSMLAGMFGNQGPQMGAGGGASPLRDLISRIVAQRGGASTGGVMNNTGARVDTSGGMGGKVINDVGGPGGNMSGATAANEVPQNNGGIIGNFTGPRDSGPGGKMIGNFTGPRDTVSGGKGLLPDGTLPPPDLSGATSTSIAGPMMDVRGTSTGVAGPMMDGGPGGNMGPGGITNATGPQDNGGMGGKDMSGPTNTGIVGPMMDGGSGGVGLGGASIDPEVFNSQPQPLTTDPEVFTSQQPPPAVLPPVQNGMPSLGPAPMALPPMQNFGTQPPQSAGPSPMWRGFQMPPVQSGMAKPSGGFQMPRPRMPQPPQATGMYGRRNNGLGF